MSVVGKIGDIDGKFYAVSVDGSQRELKSGDSIFDGEKVIGDKNNKPYDSAVIDFDNGENSIVVLGDSEELMESTSNSPQEEVQEATDQPKDEIASLLSDEGDVDDIETAGEEGSPGAESSEGGQANFAEANGGIADINADLRSRVFQDAQEDNFHELDEAEEARRGEEVPTTTVTPPVDTTPPTLDAQTFSYAENQTAGAEVGAVVATDNVSVTGYTFATSHASDDQLSADEFYAIDNAGKITITAAGVASGVNDYETGSNTGDYDVIATDATGNTNSNNYIE